MLDLCRVVEVEAEPTIDRVLVWRVEVRNVCGVDFRSVVWYVVSGSLYFVWKLKVRDGRGVDFYYVVW